MPDISLIICTRNRPDIIPETLEAIKKQTLDPEKYEIIVVDQSTDDKTKCLVENYPKFKYIKLNSIGISVSRNEGIKQSLGDIIAFVDDDIIFDENYLANILNFFNNSELKPDMCGGKTILKFLGEKPEWISGPLLGILAHSDFGNEPVMYDSHPKHVPYTCNMAIRRKCINEIGQFLEFFRINEDVMYALKVRNAGYNVIYNPDMTVYHKIPAERLTYDYYKNKYRIHGLSDAYLYYVINTYSLKDIPAKIVTHLKRLITGLVLQHFKKNIQDKYYQKLRYYYNSGYIRGMFSILLKRGKINENS